ncbi:glyceraldehyde-3-phosphate dehydrogenase, type I [Batrachochytrium salamandrivorans]|nr:glyceraldehyde-3-phosphate dehydrogenase, type I [Batrachochytrium salamandrivorans]
MPTMRKVAVNGFGRMGRLTARILLLRGEELGMELVHVNEKLGNAEMAAYLLEFDTTHGRFPLPVSFEGPRALLVNNKHKIIFSNEPNPAAIAWSDEIDLIFECTGAILTLDKLNLHFHANAKPTLRVVVSAPVDDDKVLNVVMGCNDHLVTSSMQICTAASCTTNCAAPVKRLAAGRSGASNLSPTTTGSSQAITMIYPHLKGKLNGLAIRVPVQNASLTDLVLVVKRPVAVNEVNSVLQAASDKNPGVLGVEHRHLVSTDYANDSRSSIVDAPSTQVVNGRMIKILAWYDNEWGYVNRMVDLAQLMLNKANAASKL